MTDRFVYEPNDVLVERGQCSDCVFQKNAFSCAYYAAIPNAQLLNQMMCPAYGRRDSADSIEMEAMIDRVWGKERRAAEGADISNIGITAGESGRSVLLANEYIRNLRGDKHQSPFERYSLPVLRLRENGCDYRVFSFMVKCEANSVLVFPRYFIDINSNDFGDLHFLEIPSDIKYQQISIPFDAFRNMDMELGYDGMLLFLELIYKQYVSNRFVDRTVVSRYAECLQSMWPGAMQNVYQSMDPDFMNWIQTG